MHDAVNKLRYATPPSVSRFYNKEKVPMNRQRITVAAVAFALAAVPAASMLVTSASAQEAIGDVFQKKCLSCHGPAATVPANLRGPALNGISGKNIAAVKGFTYSDGLKAKASMKWTPANLDAYLAKPKDFAPGTKMIPSVADAAQRKAIIEHLKTYK